MAIKSPPQDKAMKPDDVEQEFLFPEKGVTIKAKSMEDALKKYQAMQEDKV